MDAPPTASLQARLRLAVVGAALLFVLHAAALGAMTRFLGKDAQYLKEAIDSAGVTKSIELDLLRYDHANQADPPPGSGVSAAEIAAKLQRDLADVRRDINTPEEEQLVDEIGRRLDAYLSAHREARERGLPGSEARGLLATDFTATQALAERLVDLNVEQANQLLSQATSWYRFAVFVTIVAAVAVGVGLAFALLGFDRWIRRPLAAAASAIARFEAGDRASRAEETGPTEIREIAETFNDMAATLTRQEHDRIAFIGGVAHDLRGPVSAIQMANAMLDPEGPLRGARAEQTRAILARQTARLERMVGDFLDAVQIHAGHLDMKSEPVNLGEIVRESVEQYRPIATDHELVASIPPGPVMIQGDAMRLGQVLNNLLSNAAKYSPKGGPIDITLTLEPGEAVLAVTDRGIGIQPGEYDQIFEPFRRTGASRDLTPGVGLGLSIAKRIVEAHGGRIALTSTPGRGSTFRVHLPTSPPADPPR
jgi:signal transduction histidine kinase